MAKNGKVPAWVWIGCGCGLCILLIVGGLVALGFAGFSMFSNAIEDMANPELRQAKVEEMLGAENGFPAGYHAHSVFSIPFALKLAMISDGPEPEVAPGSGLEEKAEMMGNLVPQVDDLGAHSFIYLEAKGMRDDQRIEDVLGGERAGRTTSINLGLDFDSEKDLGEGLLDAAGTSVEWRAARGVLGLQDGETEAQWVAVRFRCADKKPRDGVWIEHPPGEGSLADAARLTAFLNHFSPCP